MNTFPYESLEAAIEAAGGYVTWGTAASYNTASVVLAVLGIVVSVVSGLMVTAREDRLLNEASARLADKYNN